VNPFKDTIGRKGFVWWTAIFIAVQFIFWFTVAVHNAPYYKVWLPLRLILVVAFLVLSFLVFMRRIWDTSISNWVALLYFVPLAGFIAWIALFFVPTGKATKSSHLKKLRRILLVLGCLLVVVATIFIWSRIFDRVQTHNRFQQSQALATVTNYYHEQAVALGITVNDSDIAKTCYKNQPIGGGPFGGGPELWCGVSVTKTFAVPPDTAQIDSLLDKLNAIAKAEGMNTSVGTNTMPGSYVRTPNYNSSTYIEYSAAKGNDYDPSGFGCSVYAKSNYLPYDDKGDYILEFPGQASQNYAPGTKQASLYYELKCDGSAAYVPAGYIYLK
jgi:uncharacterized membrane protein YhaH (DUF805 family)